MTKKNLLLGLLAAQLAGVHAAPGTAATGAITATHDVPCIKP